MFAPWKTIVACQDLNFVKQKHVLNVNAVLSQTYVPLCDERMCYIHDNELLFHVDAWKANPLAGTGSPVSIWCQWWVFWICFVVSLHSSYIMLTCARQSLLLFLFLENHSWRVSPGSANLSVQPLPCSFRLPLPCLISSNGFVAQ